MITSLAPSALDVGASLLVREATEADDQQICAQMRRTAMPGRLSLAISHDPSFFASIEVEGYARRVIVAEQAQRIVGVGLMAKRRVYLDGEPADVGYLSSLRLDPELRPTTAFLRGNRLMRGWNAEQGAPFYLASILQDNVFARRLLTAGRTGLPASQHVGELCTAAIPLLRRGAREPAPGLRVVRGGAVGAEAIVEALHRFGRVKQFFPVYTVEDIAADSGTLRGLGLEDFHVALSGDRVVGVLACWNQAPFRRLVVAGYGGSLRLARPLLSAVARGLGLGPLPRVGDAVRSLVAAGLAVENNDPRIFRALLHSVLRAGYGSGAMFLMVGLMEQDPLREVVGRYRHWPTRSGVYALQWGGVPESAGLKGRIPYLELGSL